MTTDEYRLTPNVAPSFLKSIEIQKTANYLKNELPTIVESVILYNGATIKSLTGDYRFIEMSINESMLHSFVYGYMDVRNINDWIGKLNFTGTEQVIIKFGFIDSTELLEFVCTIYSVKIINNFVDNLTTRINSNGVVDKTISYRLEFISEEIFNNVFDKSILYGDKDFIGYIAKASDGEIPGLVNTIADILKVDIDIEETRNGIWLKSGELSFPEASPQGQINLSQLMQYLCKYAVSKDNTDAVNYFFWKDRDGYHFKSVENLLNTATDIDSVIFNLETEDESDKFKVRGITVINQYDSLEFLQNKVYSSHYIRTRPNYDEAYHDFLSSSSGFTYDIVDYDYHRDWEKIKHVEEFKLLSETIPTSVLHENKKPKPTTRVSDKIFGYYDKKTNNSIDVDNRANYSTDSGYGSASLFGNRPWWEYLSRDVTIEGNVVHHDSRTSNTSWQTQFDMTELEIPILYTINKNIREPLLAKRKNFVRLKDIKRKWEAYRCVVCCLSSGAGSPADSILRSELSQSMISDVQIVYGIGDTPDTPLLDSLGLTEFFIEEFGSLQKAKDAIFGESGPFGDMGQEYRVVAAGAFTDTINYESDSSYPNGLTYSYDLSKAPYNQTIGEFYNIKAELPNYVKYVIERGLRQYTTAITKTQERIDALQDFLNQVDGWVDKLDEINVRFLNQECLEDSSTYLNPTKKEYWPNGGHGVAYKQIGDPLTVIDTESIIVTPNTSSTYRGCVRDWTVNPRYAKIPDPTCNPAEPDCGLIDNPLYFPVPSWVKSCSKHQSGLVRGLIAGYGLQMSTTVESQAIGYDLHLDREVDNSLSSNFSNLSNPISLDSLEINPINALSEIKRCLETGDCILTGCMNEIQLEIAKKRGAIEMKFLLAQIQLITEVKNKLEQNYIEKWQGLYNEWWNRKAFFYSKLPTPGEVMVKDSTSGVMVKTKISSPISLYNISSIRRKPIRGSRYEILAKSIGVEGGEVGEWAYNIFFGNATSLQVPDDISRETTGYTYDSIYFPGSSNRNVEDVIALHPYYDQGYSIKNGLGSFVTQRRPYYIYEYRDNFILNNSWHSVFLEDPKILSLPYPESSTIETGFYMFPVGQVDEMPGMTRGRLMSFDLNSIPGYSDQGFTETFNVFSDDLSLKKPPNIKREEIASYVRIEFKSPIGLDRLAEFPNGFIREAGSEYFLPYLVSLTSGPNGRQSIRNNIAVIGLDPYGFDVAVKKMHIEDHSASKRYSWHDEQTRYLNETSMDLWPEYGFETERPYYTSEPKTFYSNSDAHHGDGTIAANFSSYDNDESVSTRAGYGYDNWASSGIGTTDKHKIHKDSNWIKSNLDVDGNNVSLKSAGVDPEHKQTANGSGYLIHSHKKINPHRSWWSFDFPKNIYIPQKISGLFSTYGLPASIMTQANNHVGHLYYNLYGRTDHYLDDLEGLRLSPGLAYGYYGYNNGLLYGSHGYGDVTGVPVYGYHGTSWWSNSELDQWISLADIPETKAIMELGGSESPNSPISFIPKQGDGFLETMNVHTTIPEIDGFFSDTTNHWMSGNYILYRPGLLTTDVWKYDLSGETEYGVVHPPTSHPNYDLFDQNFAAQFVVHARRSNMGSCSDNYTCANPKGAVTTFGCPEEDPYCNCPAQDMIPDEKEPTYLELYALYSELKECELIKEHLGEEYLGCVWSDPNNPCSCNCPEIGDKFKTYLEYSRTCSTFWETPRNTPLLRNTQITQLFSQKISILVPATVSVKVGNLIELTQYNIGELVPEQKNLHGKWLVLAINHIFTKSSTQGMYLTLCRDGLPVSPDETF